MKIKTYSLFLESDKKIPDGNQHDYSIYDWSEDLKSYEWMTNPEGSKVNINSIKMWTDHFIGDGWFDKISNHVENIFNSLKKVDTDYINDRMYDVYDEIPEGKKKHTSLAVLYGDIEKYNSLLSRKFSGSIYIPKCNEVNKFRVIIHIIKEMILPTLFIGGWRSNALLRTGKDECFVTDKKYQCQNFNIDNYIKPHHNITKTSGGYDIDISKKKKYDINLFLDMYQPSVTINIGGHSDSMATGVFNLREIESKLDDVLPSILHDIDYKEVIFDQSRFDRKFNDNVDTSEYTLKILLNI